MSGRINFNIRLVTAVVLLGTFCTIAGGEVVITFDFPLEDIRIEPFGDYWRVRLEGAELPEDVPGVPWLPAKYVNIVIPAGVQVVSVEARGDETVVASDVVVVPVQPPQALSEPAPARWWPIRTGRPARLPRRSSTGRCEGWSVSALRAPMVRRPSHT